MFKRGITTGCAVGLYCPDSPVTRAQMSVFMQRLGGVATPSSINAFNDTGGPVDPDASPMICETADYIPLYPQTAFTAATA